MFTIVPHENKILVVKLSPTISPEMFSGAVVNVHEIGGDFTNSTQTTQEADFRPLRPGESSSVENRRNHKRSIYRQTIQEALEFCKWVRSRYEPGQAFPLAKSVKSFLGSEKDRVDHGEHPYTLGVHGEEQGWWILGKIPGSKHIHAKVL